MIPFLRLTQSDITFMALSEGTSELSKKLKKEAVGTICCTTRTCPVRTLRCFLIVMVFVRS